MFSYSPYAHAQLEHEIVPLVHLQEQYDSNIYLTNSFREGDVISTISPGFSLLLSHPRFKLSCTYLHDFVYFRDNPQLDYKGHNLDFNLETKVTEHLRFFFTENYIRSNDPVFQQFAGPDVQQTGVGIRAPYNQNTLSPQLQYQFGPEDLVRLTYGNTRYTQKASTSNNYTNHLVDGNLTYWLNDNNGINLQCSHDMGYLQAQPNFKSDRIAPRLIYRFTRQAEVFLDYSYTRTYYNNNEPTDTDEDYFVQDFDAGFKVSPLSSVNLEGKLGYYWRNGHTNTDSQGFIYRLCGEKRFSSGTVFMDYRGGYTENFFGIRDEGFYEFWLVSTGCKYNYKDILTFQADGSFTNADYIQTPIEKLQTISQKKIDMWEGNIFIRYRITALLAFELKYKYLDNKSNRDSLTSSYIDNRITGRLEINFQR